MQLSMQGLGLILLKTLKISTKKLLRDLPGPVSIDNFLADCIEACPEKFAANFDRWTSGIGIEAVYALAGERSVSHPDFASALRATKYVQCVHQSNVCTLTYFRVAKRPV